jgi:hypothetical protein
MSIYGNNSRIEVPGLGGVIVDLAVELLPEGRKEGRREGGTAIKHMESGTDRSLWRREGGAAHSSNCTPNGKPNTQSVHLRWIA